LELYFGRGTWDKERYGTKARCDESSSVGTDVGALAQRHKTEGEQACSERLQSIFIYVYSTEYESNTTIGGTDDATITTTCDLL
jgi:hypothetical protein